MSKVTPPSMTGEEEPRRWIVHPYGLVGVCGEMRLDDVLVIKDSRITPEGFEKGLYYGDHIPTGEER